MSNSVRCLLTSTARLLRQPVSLVIFGIGAMAGIPIGRLLHHPPWRAVAAPPAPGHLLPVSHSLPQHQTATALSPAEVEVQRAVDGMGAVWAEWQKEAGYGIHWLPMPIVQAALDLGGRQDVEDILNALQRRTASRQFINLVMCSWADRDPEAAWDFFLKNVRDRKWSSSQALAISRPH